MAGLNKAGDVLLRDEAQVAHVGEDDKAGEKAGEAVEERDPDGVRVELVVEVVVGGESGHAAVADVECEEDLDGGVAPRLHVEQPLPLGRDVELDADPGAREQPASDAEDEEDEVGEEGREPSYLSRTLKMRVHV